MKAQIYLSIFGILLFLGVILTIPLFKTTFNKTHDSIKSNAATSGPPNDGTKWVQTFDDGFNSFNSSDHTGLWKTSTQWGPDYDIGSNGVSYPVDTQDPNNPLRYINPFSVSNGILTIRSAHHQAPDNKTYTTGIMTTYNTFNQKYGYFETRVKMPPGNGMWPAFWMIPRYAGSPPEFDIFEFWGNHPTMLLTTSHSTLTNPTDSHCYSTKPDISEDFHTYGFKWDSSALTWFFDGQQVCQFPTQSDQNQPFYMILGSGVTSGTYAGTTDSTNVWPSDMQIDYVRVWQKADQITSANLALHRPVTASSVENESSTLTQANAVDGDASSRWSSNWSDPQWIAVDLGQRYVLNRVIINWSYSYGKSYQIQVSDDGTNWTPIYSTTIGDGGIDDIHLSETGRYVRMYGTERNVWNDYQYGYSLYEFEVYGSPATVAPIASMNRIR